MTGWFSLLPEASVHAAQVDRLIGWFGLLVFALTTPVFVLMLAFAIRYRRGKQVNRRHAEDRNIWLELSWSVIPFLLILGFFIVSARQFFDMHRDPSGALPVSVVAKQWMWKFQQPGGQREIDELHVPVGQAVTLTMTSQDVIHSLFIPALRIKQDVLPGRYTNLSFTATRPGSYPLECSQFCGASHAHMLATVHVLTPADYQLWLRTADQAVTPAADGAKLYTSLGCATCHDRQGPVTAPSLAGLYGHEVRLADGRTVTADADYLRRAIVDPGADVVAGYRPVMPSYARLASDDDMNALLAYLRSKGDK